MKARFISIVRGVLAFVRSLSLRGWLRLSILVIVLPLAAFFLLRETALEGPRRSVEIDDAEPEKLVLRGDKAGEESDGLGETLEQIEERVTDQFEVLESSGKISLWYPYTTRWSPLLSPRIPFGTLLHLDPSARLKLRRDARDKLRLSFDLDQPEVLRLSARRMRTLKLGKGMQPSSQDQQNTEDKPESRAFLSHRSELIQELVEALQRVLRPDQERDPFESNQQEMQQSGDGKDVLLLSPSSMAFHFPTEVPMTLPVQWASSRAKGPFRVVVTPIADPSPVPVQTFTSEAFETRITLYAYGDYDIQVFSADGAESRMHRVHLQRTMTPDILSAEPEDPDSAQKIRLIWPKELHYAYSQGGEPVQQVLRWQALPRMAPDLFYQVSVQAKGQDTRVRYLRTRNAYVSISLPKGTYRWRVRLMKSWGQKVDTWLESTSAVVHVVEGTQTGFASPVESLNSLFKLNVRSSHQYK